MSTTSIPKYHISLDGKAYPLVDLGPTRHIKLSLSHVLRLSFEFVSAVGHAVKRIVRVGGCIANDTISFRYCELGREDAIPTIVMICNRSSHTRHGFCNERSLGSHGGPAQLIFSQIYIYQAEKLEGAFRMCQLWREHFSKPWGLGPNSNQPKCVPFLDRIPDFTQTDHGGKLDAH